MSPDAGIPSPAGRPAGLFRHSVHAITGGDPTDQDVLARGHAPISKTKEAQGGHVREHPGEWNGGDFYVQVETPPRCVAVNIRRAEIVYKEK